MGRFGRSFLVSLFVLFATALIFGNNKAFAAEKTIRLAFTPFDVEVDPEQPVVYMTDLGSKKIYSVNIEKGTIKSLELPYAAERMTLSGQKLYVTQMKRSHSKYNFGPYDGGIAVIDKSNFQLEGVKDVDIDPYDIAVDKKGYIFITPGSGQHSNLKVYNLMDWEEVKSTSHTYVHARSTIYFNENNSKVYMIDSDISPRDIRAAETNNGVLINSYDSPYHGDYTMLKTAKITPDGQAIYNYKNAYALNSLQSGDLVMNLQFDRPYTDFAFSLKDHLTFGANGNGGIDVYPYNETNYLYTLRADKIVKQLFFKEGLIAIEEDVKGNSSLSYYKDATSEKLKSISQFFRTATSIKDVSFENEATEIPIDSSFVLNFTQGITKINKDAISLSDGNKEATIAVTAKENQLVIQPQELNKNTKYTLSLSKGAVTGYAGEKLVEPMNITFTSKVPDVTDVNVSVNRDEAPLKYIFTASATDGVDPQYQFSIKKNDEWVVLQKYSSSRNLIWKPTMKGPYQFLVEAKSNGTKEASKTETFSEAVTDNQPPNVTVKQRSYQPTNKAVEIMIEATDNVGVREIRMPNGNIVKGSTASYTALENGEYLFEVEDLLGNVRTQSIVVDSIDRNKPTIEIQPNITTATKGNVTLAITANDDVGFKCIQLPNKETISEQYATFTVTKNGDYKFTVQDLAGNITTKTITISNIYSSIPKIDVIDTVGDTHKTITGKSQPNLTVYAKLPSNKVYKAKASAKGVFTIKIPKQKLGTKIVMYAKDSLGQQSKSKTIKVMDSTPPSPPKVNKVTIATTFITGKTEKNAFVYVYSNNTRLGMTHADSKGNFRMPLTKRKKGTVLSVYVADQAMNKSKVVKVSIK